MAISGPTEAFGSDSFERAVKMKKISGERWEATVKVRSTRPSAPARIHPRGDGSAEVELLSPEEGVLPGQACVF